MGHCATVAQPLMRHLRTIPELGSQTIKNGSQQHRQMSGGQETQTGDNLVRQQAAALFCAAPLFHVGSLTFAFATRAVNYTKMCLGVDIDPWWHWHS